MNSMRFLKNYSLCFVFLIAPLLVGCDEEEAPEAKPRVKRVIKVQPMEFRFIELEDGARYGMGENLYNRLVTRLQDSEEFIVIVDEEERNANLPEGARALISAPQESSEPQFDPSDRLRFDFSPLATAAFSAQVEGLTFSHGSKGIRNFSGFTREYRNPWNSGDFESRNEFPPRSLQFQTSWFGNSFDPLGSEETGTLAGIDAGQEGEFNIIIASFHYKRDRFNASASIDTRIENLADSSIDAQEIEAEGAGFLFALGVSLQALSVEFGIVKNDALKKTFDQATDLLVDEITEKLRALPFRSKIEEIGPEGIILSAGRREGLEVGDIFLHRSGSNESKLRIKEVFYIGSILEVIEGSGAITSGDVVEWEESESNLESIPDNQIAAKGFVSDQLPNGAKGLFAAQGIEVSRTKNILANPKKKITFDPPEFSSPNGDAERALSLKNTILLPYLLYRWTQYDQEVEQQFSPEPRQNIQAKADLQWNMKLIQLRNAWQQLDALGKSYGEGIKVAIIDSGVDYNHRNLGAAFDRKNVGFDYFSHDARPFDDNSHGTAVAGVIAAQGVRTESVGIAPDAQILSYRVFNPYGETRSAHLYQAFSRAIEDGARIILAPWSTQRFSEAMKAAIEFAAANNVLVITGAGDRGDSLVNSPYYPAQYGSMDNVIAVANINRNALLSQVNGRFSNYGSGFVDIAAPGENLSVLAPRSEYLERSGTDLAAAHVAGAAALALSVKPNLSAAELKAILLQSADEKPELVPFISEGRILNLAKTIQLVQR